MDERVVISRSKYLLTLIPFIGFFIAWIVAWRSIYKTTQEKKYIIIHYVIWVVVSIIFFVIFIISYVLFISKLATFLKLLLTLLVLYIVLVMMSLSALAIAKGIIEKYEVNCLK
ncbi:MAG: hypothetical protein E7382_05240 [Clostridiales bacterium]|nr:hypothetical protein [Clostridiales bacterium]